MVITKEPVTAPIIGVTKVSHVETAAEAVEVKLSAEEIRFLEELYIPHGIAGHN